MVAVDLDPPDEGAELGRRFDPGGGVLFEEGDLLFQPGNETGPAHRVDVVPGQVVVHVKFTHLHGLADGGDLHIGTDPQLLDGTAGDPVEHLDLEGHAADVFLARAEEGEAFLQLFHLQHGALAKGAAVAHHHRPVAVPERGGENFGRRSGKLADHDDQRPRPLDGGVFIHGEGDAAPRIPALDHRPRGDEKSGQRHGLAQAPAAVAAQVHDHRLNALFPETNQNLPHVLAAPLEVGVAPHRPVEVHVEARQIYDPHLFAFHREDLAVSFALGEEDLRPGDGDAHRDRAAALVARKHRKGDAGLFLAPDVLDRLFHRHVDEVGGGAVFLSDCDDAVIDLEPAVPGRRAAGNQRHDLDEAVVAGQRGADARERKTHVDVEVLGRLGGHVVGVGAVHMGQRIEVDAQNVDLFAFFHGVAHVAEPFQHLGLGGPGVPPGGIFHGLPVFGIGALFQRPVEKAVKDDLVLDALPPEFVQFGVVFAPGQLAPVGDEFLVFLEVDLALKHVGRKLTVGAVAGAVAGVDLEGEGVVPPAQSVEKFFGVQIEAFDVLLGQKALVSVQSLDVEIDMAPGHFGRQGQPPVVLLDEDLLDLEGDVGKLLVGEALRFRRSLKTEDEEKRCQDRSQNGGPQKMT